METITLPSREVEIWSTDTPWHSLKLNDEVDRIIPAKHDIVSLVITEVPDGLKKVHLDIGGVKIITWDKSDIEKRQNLFSEGFPFSQSYFQYTCLRFEYDAEYIAVNQTTEMEDEYIDEVEHSDTEEEYFDGYEYHYGYRVHRKRVPTGRQIAEVVEAASVWLPQLIFNILPSKDTPVKTLLPFWDSITVDQQRNDKDYIQRLVEKYKLHIPDGTDVFQAYDSGEPFTAKLQNYINFSGGFAGKTYVF